MECTVLYEDSQIAIIIKPIGPESETEVPSMLKNQLGGEFYPVHRLDRNVGGVMVYARTKKAASLLSALIQQGKLIKEYYALVTGTPPETGVLEDLLWKDVKKNKVYVVKRRRAGVKSARLEYSRLTEGTTSLVRVRLDTGRSHQIRVQFASRGFPLAGDHKYGARDTMTSPLLFSCGLTFPWNGKMLHFTAEPNWVAEGQKYMESLQGQK